MTVAVEVIEELNRAQLLLKSKMSILNILKSPLSLIRKDLLSAVSVRALSSEEPAEAEAQEGKAVREKRKRHSVTTCLQYMDSEAYKTTYGDKPVWHVYVRNFKGSVAPQTRERCKRGGVISTGSPCPICRDEYLLPHYLNVKLLKQFISPHGGNLIDTRKTGVCQSQQRRLAIAIKRAQNYGLITFPVPHRAYDYRHYLK